MNYLEPPRTPTWFPYRGTIFPLRKLLGDNLSYVGVGVAVTLCHLWEAERSGTDVGNILAKVRKVRP